MAVTPVTPITLTQVAFFSNKALTKVEKDAALKFNLDKTLMHHRVFRCHTTSQRSGACSFTLFLTKKVGGNCHGVVAVDKIALAYKFTKVVCK